jgi:hypothetical protein
MTLRKGLTRRVLKNIDINDSRPHWSEWARQPKTVLFMVRRTEEKARNARLREIYGCEKSAKVEKMLKHTSKIKYM